MESSILALLAELYTSLQRATNELREVAQERDQLRTELDAKKTRAKQA